jgi:hypothetical protein
MRRVQKAERGELGKLGESAERRVLVVISIVVDVQRLPFGKHVKHFGGSPS